MDGRIVHFNERKLGWGARIRTWEWRYQKPLPYRLATPHRRHKAGVRARSYIGFGCAAQRPKMAWIACHASIHRLQLLPFPDT